jgi:ABC-type transport system involved in multi-copper enzyme maturation permease subunit
MNAVITIALNTFRESIRSKVLYTVFFFALIVITVSAFFGTVTIGDQVKVIKDFGLFSISLFTVLYASISGAALLFKELSRKTIYNILAKPVERWEFVVGKYCGMLLTAATMLSLMGLALSVFVAAFEGRFDLLLFQGYVQMLLQLMVVCASAIFFSSIVVTPMLSGAFTFGLFLAARSTEYLLYFIREGQASGAMATILRALYAILPPLDKVEVSNQIVYGIEVPLSHTVWSAAVCFGYSGVLLVLAVIFFSRRDFN